MGSLLSKQYIHFDSILNSILDLHLRILDDRDVVNTPENDVKLNGLFEQLDSIIQNPEEEPKFCECFIENYIDSPLLERQTFIIILQNLAALPSLMRILMKKLKKSTQNGMEQFLLLECYDSVFLLGYKQPLPIDCLAMELNIDLEQYRKFKVDESMNLKKSGIFKNILDKMNSSDFSPIVQLIEGIEKREVIEDENLKIAPPQVREEIKHMFNNKLKFNVPIKKILKYLDKVAEDFGLLQNFILPVVSIKDDPTYQALSSSAKNQIRLKIDHIEKSIENGKYHGIIKEFASIEKINPKNSTLYIKKALIYEQLTVSQSDPYIYFEKQMSLKLKSLLLSIEMNNPRFEIFEHFIIGFQHTRHFKAALTLTLSLLRIYPFDCQLNIIAAFCAHQIDLKYKHYLYRASIYDPLRLVNFMQNYWFYYKFTPMSYPFSTKSERVNFNTYIEKLNKELENQFKMWCNMNINKIPPPTILGNDFPYNKITGLELNDIFGEESTVYPESFGLLTQNEILDPDEDEGWEEFDEWVESIGDTWEHSEEYLKLPKYTHKVREELPFDISGLYYSEFQELPNSWDETNMEKILFQVPYSVDEHKYYFTSICRIMPNFCDFLTRSMNKKNHPNLRNISKMFKKNSQKFNSMIDDLFANRK